MMEIHTNHEEFSLVSFREEGLGEYTGLFLAATTNLDSNIWTVTGEEEGQPDCWHWSNLRVIYMQLVLTLHPNLAPRHFSSGFCPLLSHS